jgi:hypothetical protein
MISLRHDHKELLLLIIEREIVSLKYMQRYDSGKGLADFLRLEEIAKRIRESQDEN